MHRHGASGISTSLPKIALVGNPNVGKSAVFGVLTGRYAVVSNYPGTTVELAIGNSAIAGTQYEVIDTPGANSLTPSSEDERVARDILLDSKDLTVLQVADAKNLDRSLMLTCQLGELGLPTVLALNMWDELPSRSLSIDVAKLRQLLGIAAVRTVATEGMGFHAIRNAIPDAKTPSIEVDYGHAVTGALGELTPHLARFAERTRGLALMLLSGETALLDKLSPELPPQSVDAIRAISGRLQEKLPIPVDYFLKQRRAQAVRAICNQVVARTVRVDDARRPVARTLSTALVGFLLFLIGYKFVGLALAAVQAATRSPFPIPGIAWAGGAAMLILSLVVALRAPKHRRSSLPNFISTLSLSPVTAIPIVVVALWLLYVIVGRFGAGTVVNFVEGKIFGSPLRPSGGFDLSVPIPFAGKSLTLFHVPFDGLNHYLAGGIAKFLSPESFMFRLFLDEHAGLISVGLRYSLAIVLPIVFFFFLAFAVMEDSGYLPRLSVLMDRIFRAMGLNGKAVLPMVLGLGCGAMAALSTRILGARKERLIATILLALAIPCSAQLGIIAAVLSQVSAAGIVLYAVAIASQLFIVGKLAAALIPGRPSGFLLELPPLRLPRLGNIVLKTLFRLRWFLAEAVPLFLIGTAVLFFTMEIGVLSVVERALSPVVVGLLGLPAGTARGFLLGFLRRDYGTVALFDMFRARSIDAGQVLVALVVITLFVPCIANFLVIIKEQGAKRAFLIAGFIIPYAVLVGAVVRLLLVILRIKA